MRMTYVSPPLVPAKRQRSKEFGDTDAKRGIPFAYAKTIRVLVFLPTKTRWVFSFASLRESSNSLLR
jgi:hypothetical protein